MLTVMLPRMIKLFKLLALFLFTFSSAARAEETSAPKYPAVTVYEAKKIITMEPALPEAKFAAVADGIILGVGRSIDDLQAWTKDRSVTVDRQFAGKTLMPGFIEPHIHPMQAILMLPLPFIAPEEWKLPGRTYPAANGRAGYEKLLRKELSKSKEKLFITWGHHRLFHEDMDRKELDRIAPNRAVVVWQRSFHEIIANSKALELLNIGTEQAFKSTIIKPGVEPHHASFEKGVISETALFGGLEVLRPYLYSPAKISLGLSQMKKMMLENGVTTSADLAFGGFGGVDNEAKIFKSLFDNPQTPSRILAIPTAPVVGDDPAGWLKTTKAKYGSSKMLFSNRVKLLADGAFFAQYMQMNPPGYSDGHEGKWIMPPDELSKYMQKFWKAGWTIHTHVNGDKGLDVVLGEIEKLPPRGGQTHVLEHLGFSTEAQNRRIGKLGLMVSAQPNYIRVLAEAYSKTGLGTDRATQMNRLGSLERKGVPLGLHSDFNMAPIDPLFLAQVAATRRTLQGNQPSPNERLSLDKALRAITIEAAQVIGLDHMVGSIAAGKKADFVILDQNPYDVGADGLDDIAIDGVIFEGRYFPAK